MTTNDRKKANKYSFKATYTYNRPPIWCNVSKLLANSGEHDAQHDVTNMYCSKLVNKKYVAIC